MVSPGFLALLLHKEYGDEIDELAEYSIEDQAEEVENLPEFSKGEFFSLSNSKEASQSKVARCLDLVLLWQREWGRSASIPVLGLEFSVEVVVVKKFD